VILRIVEPKKLEVTRGCGKLDAEDLHKLFCAADVIMNIRTDGRGMWHKRQQKIHKNFVREPVGKSSVVMVRRA
jgi:exosome complex RNA-binding protein Rrp42 (RNase PH superfamily)